MSDPAVEAAARAWEWYPVPKDIPLVVRSVPLAAAREALKPIPNAVEISREEFEAR
ncbi:hypothetical protein PBI_DUKE13_88 [Mycobacterium phage Duke13]|uniref:Uncharacterized protein n=1 Tax=Mycobacterium phage Duke13 TaxID=2499038 RepID=A0A3S9UAW1_9CAUD|nr:hypothetical protein PBI_DUKE13_88 [Mycobacterium phage Duke13]